MTSTSTSAAVTEGHPERRLSHLGIAREASASIGCDNHFSGVHTCVAMVATPAALDLTIPLSCGAALQAAAVLRWLHMPDSI